MEIGSAPRGGLPTRSLAVHLTGINGPVAGTGGSSRIADIHA
jgi:hypothetical protein